MKPLSQVEVASRTSPVPGATAAEMRVMRADAARVRAQHANDVTVEEAAA